MLLDESGVGINSNMNAVIYHQTAVVNYQHPALTKYQNLTDKSSKWEKNGSYCSVQLPLIHFPTGQPPELKFCVGCERLRLIGLS